MPGSRREVSVWRVCPDNQKPTGECPAAGAYVARVSLGGQGDKRCASLRRESGRVDHSCMPRNVPLTLYYMHN